MFTNNIEDHPRPIVICDDGRTKQSMKDDSDINLIMKKYKKTGLINFVNNNQGEYMEIDDIDYHEALTIVTEADQMFQQMPASLRKKFQNDPGQFLNFVQNPDNLPEMEELGLIAKNKPSQQEPEATVAKASTAESAVPDSTST